LDLQQIDGKKSGHLVIYIAAATVAHLGWATFHDGVVREKGCRGDSHRCGSPVSSLRVVAWRVLGHCQAYN